MPLSNSYSLKTAKDQRPCFICGKISSSVLDAPDDFFFVCLSHTKDGGFCTSSAVESAVGTGRECEIEKLKREISELKAPKDKDLKESMDAKDVKEQKTEPKQTEGQGPKIYKLNRSILYLREQEK